MKSDANLRDVAEYDLPVFFEHQRDLEANRMAAFPSRHGSLCVIQAQSIL